MKAKVEIEFKEISVEKAQKTLLDFIHALKAIGMIEEGKFEIHTSEGIITEKCILKEDRVIA